MRSGSPIISGGRLRGLRLQVPAGETTRPTRAAVREAMLSVLGPLVESARVLDLYAGCGALGLETLSRGAAHVTFVERDRRALAALRRNLTAAGLGPEASSVLAADCTRFAPAPGVSFDLVLADPPYALFEPVPAAVCRPPALSPGGHVLLERSAARIAPLQLHGLALVAERVHGLSAFALYAAPRSSENA